MGPWLTVLFLAAGIYFTVRFRGFQITGCFLWWRETAGSLLKGGNKEKKGQFASACTALAATVGTGNIAGVAAAVAVGGPGAVFWMWASAVLGMMTAYAEVYLGRKYRYKDKNGRPVCGPYAYLEKGLGMRWMGLLYAAFCVLASLGMGSMVQANAVAQSADFSASIPLPCHRGSSDRSCHGGDFRRSRADFCGRSQPGSCIGRILYGPVCRYSSVSCQRASRGVSSYSKRRFFSRERGWGSCRSTDWESGAVWNFQIVLPLRLQHPNAADGRAGRAGIRKQASGRASYPTA